MVGEIDAAKQRVRQAVRATRRALSVSEQERVRDQLTEHLSTLVAELDARRITCYLPVAGEPDTTGFLAWAQQEGIEVLLPVSLPGHQLAWAQHHVSGAGGGAEAKATTAPGLHGITEPTGPRLGPDALDTADLLLIPACSVDAQGIRLGWGFGYYDRALARVAERDDRPPIYAIVHDADLRTALPHDAHDVPVDGVVTPGAIRRFAPNI